VNIAKLVLGRRNNLLITSGLKCGGNFSMNSVQRLIEAGLKISDEKKADWVGFLFHLIPAFKLESSCLAIAIKQRLAP
jgi:hypothetical protein